MLKPILAKTAAALFAVAAVLVLPAAAADQNSAEDQNGNPCLKINCEGGTIENHCDRPVNFASCHAESESGCLLRIKSLSALAPKESLPFACKPGKLAKADGCFPPFIPVSFSVRQSGCFPDPENPDALTAVASASTAPSPPSGTPTENALRKCNAWPGQLSANATANTEGNQTVFHKDWKCESLDTHTHLHFAARMNDSNSARWLIANGANVNAKDEDGHTPLHEAAGDNATETAALLLKNGAEVNAKNNGGFTPLHYAATVNAPETAALLLKNGAEVNAKNNWDGTPLDWATRQEHSEIQSLLKRHGGRCNKWC